MECRKTYHYTQNLLLCLSLIIIGSYGLQAQKINLKGVVKDYVTGLPVENAIVVDSAEAVYSTTNALGEFTLLISPRFPLQLHISRIGYLSENFKINNSEPVLIRLQELQTELEEVLITSGYTVQRKSDFSGSVANLSSKQILTRPALSFDQLLVGVAPGVDLIQPTNALNNTPVLRIRGLNSITSGLFPLVVVDGVSMFVGAIGGVIGNNPLAEINPQDIASIDILKDASAAAIYGSRAANGVMVINTKRGRKGRVRVNYDAWVSVSKPYNLPELLGAEDYVTIKNEAMVNTGRTPGYKLMTNPDGSVVSTNWFDVAFKPGWSHSHHFSASGANSNTAYYFSLAYLDQDNFIKTNTYKRYSLRVNLDQKVNSFINTGASLSYANGKNTGPMTGAIPSNTLSSSAYNSQYIFNEPLGRMTYVLPPNVPVYNADGSYHIQNGTSVGYGLNNPSTIGTINAYNLAWILDNDVNTSENNLAFGNICGALSILTGLSFKVNYGINNILTDNRTFNNPIHGGGASSNGIASNISTKYLRTDWVNTLKYQKVFKSVHQTELLVGYEQMKTTIDSWGAERSNIADPYYKNYQGGFVNISPIGNVLSENALLSYFSTFNYDYAKKYFASLNFRRDGLSALADGNKFGNFGGASVGWNIHNEGFFKNSNLKNILNFARLRGSYGIVGNSEIGDYPAIGAYNSATYGGLPTLKYAQSGNPNLQWETSKKMDIGAEFHFFKDRISIEIDYYKNLIDGLVLKSPQALSAGIPGNYINENIGSMYNQGIELALNGQLIRNKDWSWYSNLNFSTLKNKVTSLVSDVYVPSIFGVQNMTRVGYSIGSIFAVPAIGVNPDNGFMIFQNSEGKMVQYNHSGSPKWTYLDGSPAPAIDNYKDGVIQGPSLPTFFGGWNHNIQYKNFELNINLTFVGGNLLYNGTRATNSDGRYFNSGTFIKSRWQKPGDITEIPKLQYTDNVSSGFSFAATSKVEKGDYLKLKNIQFAYNVPLQNVKLQGKISSARVYVQAVNLYTLTKYRGSDPEISINGNSIHSGKDQNVPPNAQVFSAGVQVGF